MKPIFVIDWLLIPLLVVSEYTGIELHVAGHNSGHEVWHNWAVSHIIASFLYLIALVFHIKMHWNWYKGIIHRGIGKKSKMTLLLTLVFVAVVIIGCVLLMTDGANTKIGLWHYGLGLLMSALAL